MKRIIVMVMMAVLTAVIAPPAPQAAQTALTVSNTSVEQEAGTGMTTFDLNAVSPEELVSIKGIGSVLAERIIAKRKQKGSFQTIDDLLEVQGIGKSTLARLKSYLYVSPPSLERKTQALSTQE